MNQYGVLRKGEELVKSEAERENYLYQKHLPQLLVSVMRRNCEINFSLGEKKISCRS